GNKPREKISSNTRKVLPRLSQDCVKYNTQMCEQTKVQTENALCITLLLTTCSLAQYLTHLTGYRENGHL
ncbi:MAG: hypothetical protein P8Y60_11340, partial [Calditrichota bacterium]